MESNFPVGSRVRHTLYHDFGTVVDKDQSACPPGCCIPRVDYPVVAWDDDQGNAYPSDPHYLRMVEKRG